MTSPKGSLVPGLVDRCFSLTDLGHVTSDDTTDSRGLSGSRACGAMPSTDRVRQPMQTRQPTTPVVTSMPTTDVRRLHPALTLGQRSQRR